MVTNADRTEIKRLYDEFVDYVSPSLEFFPTVESIVNQVGRQLYAYSHIVKSEEHGGRFVFNVYGPVELESTLGSKLEARPKKDPTFGYIISELHIGRRLLTSESWPSIEDGDLIMPRAAIRDIERFCVIRGK